MKKLSAFPKTLALCSSASFYKNLIELEPKLKSLGFKVKLPFVARKMAKEGNFDVARIKTWFENPADYKIKTKLMNHHFRKIKSSDAVLVVNKAKNGVEGYIGGNVLLEMLVAYLDSKPIFILHAVAKDLPLREEVLGLNPIFIEGDLTKIVA